MNIFTTIKQVIYTTKSLLNNKYYNLWAKHREEVQMTIHLANVIIVEDLPLLAVLHLIDVIVTYHLIFK